MAPSSGGPVPSIVATAAAAANGKTAKAGKRRSIFIGPKAQEILAPRLARRKPFTLSPTQYRERVHAAARKAGVEQWGPNQIRHSVSNEVKRKYGRDGEAVFLGHTADVAEEHYLETEVPLGVRIAKEIG
jgi:integrase